MRASAQEREPSGSWRGGIEQHLQRLWFGEPNGLIRLISLPLRLLGRIVSEVASQRRRAIAHDKAMPRSPGTAAVVVIGNLLVGGTGKTPLLIALAGELTRRGLRVGVISRGHGARLAGRVAQHVPASGSAADFGDEAVLVARHTGLPVVIGHDRSAALTLLTASSTDLNIDSTASMSEGRLDVVLSDDGLQHVGLRRDLELAVFDERGVGNGRCLPTGPLREPLDHALLMDAIVLNGRSARPPVPHSRIFRFELQPVGFESLDGRTTWSVPEFCEAARGESLDAMAGIGSPQRFFNTLAGLGVVARPWPLGDHEPIDPQWLARLPGRWLLMTSKDAVKCEGFDAALRARCVVLRVEAMVESTLIDWLEERLRG